MPETTFLASAPEAILWTDLVMIGFYGYFYWTARQLEHIPRQQKRGILIGVIFLIFLIAIKAAILASAYLSSRR